MVQELRNLYEENLTNHLSYEWTPLRFCSGAATGHQIVFIHQDLFLLENQIPFKVLNEVMDLIIFDKCDKILSFFADNILSPGRQKRGWFGFESGSTLNDQNSILESYGSFTFDHLLHRLHSRLSGTREISTRCFPCRFVPSRLLSTISEISTRCFPSRLLPSMFVYRPQNSR